MQRDFFAFLEKFLTELKNSSNDRVVMREWWRVTCKGFLRMTTLSFDKFFDLQRFFMMVVFYYCYVRTGWGHFKSNLSTPNFSTSVLKSSWLKTSWLTSLGLMLGVTGEKLLIGQFLERQTQIKIIWVEQLFFVWIFPPKRG